MKEMAISYAKPPLKYERQLEVMEEGDVEIDNPPVEVDVVEH